MIVFIQVDIFSLGITLYELMTLQFLPPPEVTSWYILISKNQKEQKGQKQFQETRHTPGLKTFDSDIIDGIRPLIYKEVGVVLYTV